MKIPLKYGALMAVAGAVMMLVLYLAGMHDSVEKMSSAQWAGSIGGVAIGVVFLVLAMREKRASYPADAEWGYGPALGVGVLTGLVSAILGCFFAYLYFGVINREFTDVIYQVQVAKMEERGMSAAQIERAEPMMRKWMSPGVMTAMQGFFGFLWSLILALIVAIFMRKRPVVPANVAAPPPLV